MDLFVWIVVIAVILIATLYTYRIRKQTQAYEQQPYKSKWFNLLIARLREMSQTGELHNLEWAVDFLRTYQGNPNDSEQVEQFLDVVCVEYLRGTNQQRDAIRQLFLMDSWPLFEYAETQAQRIMSQSDVDFLRIGLAAASIEGLRIDYRDFLICLWYLYSRAESAGINPQPYFKEVAELSDKETTYQTLSTADLMGSFHETEYFKQLRKRRVNQS